MLAASNASFLCELAVTLAAGIVHAGAIRLLNDLVADMNAADNALDVRNLSV